MIQRIQTIWLLLASISFFGEWIPGIIMLKTLTPGEGIFSDQILILSENLYLMIGSGVSGLLALIAVFLFRERGSQIMVSAMASLVQIFLVAGFCFLLLYRNNKLHEFSPHTGFFLSLAGIIFIWLATRGIRKDQNLIKSMDRLR